jgi:signal recognition particle GTPase
MGRAIEPVSVSLHPPELADPVKYIGIGEGQDALAPFDRAQFTRALFETAPAA